MITNWIQTFSGLAVDLDNPDPQTIVVGDIARSLARLPRYLGHTKRMIPVGEHALACAHVATLLGAAPIDIACCLHHDSGEAYYGDIVGPARKYLAESWMLMMRGVDAAVATALGLPADYLDRKIVRAIDLAMLEAERRVIHGPAPMRWSTSDRADPEILGVCLEIVSRHGMDQRSLVDHFLERHRELLDGPREVAL